MLEMQFVERSSSSSSTTKGTLSNWSMALLGDVVNFFYNMDFRGRFYFNPNRLFPHVLKTQRDSLYSMPAYQGLAIAFLKGALRGPGFSGQWNERTKGLGHEPERVRYKIAPNWKLLNNYYHCSLLGNALLRNDVVLLSRQIGSSKLHFCTFLTFYCHWPFNELTLIPSALIDDDVLTKSKQYLYFLLFAKSIVWTRVRRLLLRFHHVVTFLEANRSDSWASWCIKYGHISHVNVGSKWG